MSMTLQTTFQKLAELRAWQLALCAIERVRRESNFYHFWHE